MLSNEALNSAMPLTDVLDANNLMLMPVTGTPLEILVSATRSDDKFVTINPDGSVVPSLSDIEYIANAKDDVLGGSPHDMAFDNIVDPCVKAVQEHMRFAKNVVRPAVEDLVNRVLEQIESQNVSTLLGMEVITYNPPAPIMNSGIGRLVEMFDNTPYDNPPLLARCPNIAVSELIELMKTGSSSIDTDIEQWAASLGETCVLKIWENVFQQTQAGLNDRIVYTFRDFVEDRECGVDNALMIFLLARRLLDDPLPETEMDQRMYAEVMANYRNQAGARLCRALLELDKIGKAKTLVKSVQGTKTTVYGFVYDEWLKAGGSNEVLFGNMLDLPYISTVDNLNAKAEMLKAKWSRHAAVTATIESNKKFLRTKEALAYNFERQIREAGDEFYEEATLGNREMVIQRFREMVAGVNAEDIKDLWSLALKLVCAARFARTDAHRILSGIERITRENPSIDPREAAAVSIIEYVGHWVSSQFKIVSV